MTLQANAPPGATVPAAPLLRISGDTVRYDGVREVACRVPAETALLHLGAALCGPLRGLEATSPSGRAEIEREFAGAPKQLRRSVDWLPIGVGVDLGRPAAVHNA